MTDLEKLPNIGKVIAAKLEKAGIMSAEEFMAEDPYDVFEKLLRKDRTLCRCALASVVGAHAGRRWNLVMKAAVKKFEKRHPGHKWVRC